MTDKSQSATLHIDGGSRGNPGPAACGWSLCVDGVEIGSGGRYLGRETNNAAEYGGLIFGLEAAREIGIGSVRVFSDSQLIVNQMNGQWKVRHPNVKPLFARARRLAQEFEKVEYEYVPREKNGRADALLNTVLDEARKRGYPAAPDARPAEPELFD